MEVKRREKGGKKEGKDREKGGKRKGKGWGLGKTIKLNATLCISSCILVKYLYLK